ncbi:hypothetical protein [Humibacter sp.]|uniref:hypothetical protein n=1 Tax=Humibacter sp. TaxID=1940291 RepID=UPI002BDCD3DC|nr:hypothetical protein [Humibacter sp.]HVX07179.1 hypothetical protein [Humibacter sp.]
MTSPQPPWPVDSNGQPVPASPTGAPDLAAVDWPHANGRWAGVGPDGRPLPLPDATFGAPPAAAPPATSEAKAVPFTLLIAGGLSFIGSFMTWASADTPFGSISVSGTSNGKDGNITLFLGLLLAAVGLRRLVKKRLGTWGLVAGFLLSLAILGVGIYDTADISRTDGDGVSVNPGIGLILQLVAGIGGIVGAVMATRERSRS